MCGSVCRYSFLLALIVIDSCVLSADGDDDIDHNHIDTGAIACNDNDVSP